VRIFAAEAFDGQPVDFERDIRDVPLALPDGTTLHVRGRIDRVDEVHGSLELWDYKTGSTFRFRTKRDDPFNGGRVLQHAIYITLAQAHYGKPVALFGYFFPTEKGRGERITFAPAQLAGAPELLARLRGLIARGAFPATDREEDCAYCDYRSLCGNVAAVTAQSQLKNETARP
jgi:ATP-dependent helicase/nuclease subunit B